MKVLGIDSSTKTGLCVVEEPEEHLFPPRPKVLFSEEVETKLLLGMERARLIADRAANTAAKYAVDLVVIEGYGFANRHSLVVLVEVGTLIRDRLWRYGFQPLIVAPTQLKKFVLGKGTGKKNQILLGVHKRWRYEHDSDNVVEAYALGAVGLASAGRLPRLIKPQIEVITKLSQRPGGPAPPRRDQ